MDQTSGSGSSSGWAVAWGTRMTNAGVSQSHNDRVQAQVQISSPKQTSSFLATR